MEGLCVILYFDMVRLWNDRRWTEMYKRNYNLINLYAYAEQYTRISERQIGVEIQQSSWRTLFTGQHQTSRDCRSSRVPSLSLADAAPPPPLLPPLLEPLHIQQYSNNTATKPAQMSAIDHSEVKYLYTISSSKPPTTNTAPVHPQRNRLPLPLLLLDLFIR
jgi:hypothetical protein